MHSFLTQLALYVQIGEPSHAGYIHESHCQLREEISLAYKLFLLKLVKKMTHNNFGQKSNIKIL
jgi:hypothetical protein